jgi:pilus assembly protein CpaF
MSRCISLACVITNEIIISGGTGSGKTTLLNILSQFIPNDERIITIENAAELQLRQEHVVTLESRPPNIEGRGEVTIRQLVINACVCALILIVVICDECAPRYVAGDEHRSRRSMTTAHPTARENSGIETMAG